MNVDVAALGGTVAVSYGLTNATTKGARFAQQYVGVSRDGARTFATTVGVGPRSNYAFAAEAGGIFPGDYIGTSFGARRTAVRGVVRLVQAGVTGGQVPPGRLRSRPDHLRWVRRAKKMSAHPLSPGRSRRAPTTLVR